MGTGSERSRPSAQELYGPNWRSVIGRMGGLAKVAKYGTGHMGEIGSKGGRATSLEQRVISGRMGGRVNVIKHGLGHMTLIGRRGGEKLFELRGSEYMIQIGKRGYEKRKQKAKRKPHSPRSS